MGTEISAAATYSFNSRFFHRPPISGRIPFVLLTHANRFHRPFSSKQNSRSRRVCLVMNMKRVEVEGDGSETDEILRRNVEEKKTKKKSETKTYLVAAIMSSLGITSMAAMAVYYRFSWQVGSGDYPILEMFGTFALSVGAVVGMEFWARWAHKELWHDSLWNMHQSHHKPREGPFEVNDVFAVINAVPAIALLSFGFFNQGFIPGLCFGAGLGITMFGIAYMFVHDGLVHRRFHVGPISAVPYFRRVAAAHHLHHTGKFKGVPYGLFLGPKELSEEIGGKDELEKEIRRRINASKH